MCWNYREIREKRDEVAAMTTEVGNSLSWEEEAKKFVPRDTILRAIWSGLCKRTDITPFQALKEVHFLEE